MSTYYIGLMSGTSLDAVDAALVNFETDTVRLIDSLSLPIPGDLRQQALSLLTPGEDELARLCKLDVQFGRLFAEAILALVDKSGISAAEIQAIGSHGQTLRHFPEGDTPTSLQIGDPNLIAERTGITVIADFRRRDMAAGGQGAPLAPAFHRAVLHDPLRDSVILNVGGIANITLLPADADKPVTGFDTGPGNALLNAWAERHLQQPMDVGGEWAATGHIHAPLLERLLADPFFQKSPPKSTGREYFNLDWLTPQFGAWPELEPKDIQATLVELSAISIAHAVTRHTPQTAHVLICGGGVHNNYLLQRLAAHLPRWQLTSTAEKGVDPDWMEAMAFAWLAKQTLENQPGNLPSVTGARHAVVLGGIYPGTQAPA